MRTALPWQLTLALLTAAPQVLFAAPPAEPGTAAPKPAAAASTPAAKSASSASTPAGKPAAAPPATSTKPASATPPAAAKPAGSPTTAATKPAGSPTTTAAKPAGSPPAAPAKPAPPAPAAPGQAKGAVPTVAPTLGAGPGTDPAKDHLTLAQATAGIKGIGALFATLELAVPGKPVVQTLHCELFADKTPLTVANFVGLARGLRPWKDPKLGQWVKKPLYDGNLLHRVVPELLIQGGDPNCSVDPGCRGAGGTGEPGYTIPDELKPELRFDRAGRLAMANRGPATSGSQFFITERDAAWLNGSHTIFGQCDSPELVAELARVDAGSRDQPKVPLVIKRVTFMRKAK